MFDLAPRMATVAPAERHARRRSSETQSFVLQ